MSMKTCRKRSRKPGFSKSEWNLALTKTQQVSFYIYDIPLTDTNALAGFGAYNVWIRF